MKFVCGMSRCDAMVRLVRRAMAVPLLILAVPSAGWAQMSIQGQFAVNEAGAATYSIPIQVPPGVAGMEPRLALFYNSQAGNGFLGMGWNLAGLSSIQRCAQTKAQDGATWVAGVNYTSTDRYCLDGQRLVAMPDPAGSPTAAAGAYGADSTYYGTEREVFSRVQSFGSVGTAPYAGPSYFVVKTKEGLTMWYGSTADSKVTATNGTSSMNVVRAWSLSKVMDGAGNYMTVTYNTADLASGQHYPTRIDYTGNAAALAPTQSVQFTYESRPDVQTLYQAGAVYRNTLRLSHVLTYASGALVKDLQLNYGQSQSTGRTRLTSLSVCNGSTCLPATKLDWASQDPPLDTSKNGPSTLGLDFANYSKIDSGTRMADVNGDGLPDLVQIYLPTDGTNGNAPLRRVLLNDGSDFVLDPGYSNSLVDTYITRNGVDFGTRLVDVNRDGLPDIVQLFRSLDGSYGGESPRRIFLNVGGKFVLNETYSSSLPDVYISSNGVDYGTQLSDINGDGFVDIIQLFLPGAGEYGGVPQRRVLLNDGTRFALDPVYSSSLADTYFSSVWKRDFGTRLVDVDGNGLPDIVQLYLSTDGAYGGAPQRRVFLNKNSKFVLDAGFSNSLPDVYFSRNGDDFGTQMVDLNGDGLPDIVQLFSPTDGSYGGAPQRRVLINTGAKFVLDSTYSNSLPDTYLSRGGADLGTRFMDVNGDGLPDIVQMFLPTDGFYGGAKQRRVFLNTGSQFTSSAAYSDSLPPVSYFSLSGGVDQGWRLNDVNGDGLLDLVNFYRAGPTSFSRAVFGFSHTRDVLASITDGRGAVTSITYATPVQLKGTRYTRTATVAAPNLMFTPDWLVVSNVDRSNGLGSANRTSYWYDSAVVDVGAGRGFMGFNWVQSIDEAAQAAYGGSGVVSRTYFRQDFPYNGQVSESGRGTSPAEWWNLSRTTYTYGCFQPGKASGGCTPAPGQRYFAFVSSLDARANDLNGTALPRKRVEYKNPDAYGNPQTVVSSILKPDGSASDHSETKTNTYFNDPAKWILGRLTKQVVAATGPTVSAPVVPGSGNLPAPPTPPLPARLSSAVSTILSLILNDD